LWPRQRRPVAMGRPGVAALVASAHSGPVRARVSLGLPETRRSGGVATGATGGGPARAAAGLAFAVAASPSHPLPAVWLAELCCLSVGRSLMDGGLLAGPVVAWCLLQFWCPF
jgi:hypothetical protein